MENKWRKAVSKAMRDTAEERIAELINCQNMFMLVEEF